MKQTLLTSAKVSGLAAAIPMLLGAVPETWDHLICMLIVVCGAISTVVPVPHAGSAWVVAYKILSVAGLNFGWAANHLAAAAGTTLSGGDTDSKNTAVAQAPKADAS